MKIKQIWSYEILDSKGYPTINCILELEDGSRGEFAVPSGSSTGVNEVLELRDGDKNRYFGKGVKKAVSNISDIIAKEIIGKSFESQVELDQFLIDLDGTANKSVLGGNAILAVSAAFLIATAKQKGLELYDYIQQITFEKDLDDTMPIPFILIMEGGAHGNWSTDIQEYMIVPHAMRFNTIAERIRVGAEIFHALHDILVDRGYGTGVGYEGAFSPKEIKSNIESLDLIVMAIEKANYKPGEEVSLALDVAASGFYDEDRNLYKLHREGLELSPEHWIDLQSKWYQRYPMYSIEDPLSEVDWINWNRFSEIWSDSCMVVGDDLLTTNVKLINRAIKEKSCNSVLIKPNQIGTITETLNAIKLSRIAGMRNVMSHRGGESNSSLIADIAIGAKTEYTKFGGPDRGERLAKYNRLIQIEFFMGLK